MSVKKSLGKVESKIYLQVKTQLRRLTWAGYQAEALAYAQVAFDQFTKSYQPCILTTEPAVKLREAATKLDVDIIRYVWTEMVSSMEVPLDDPKQIILQLEEILQLYRATVLGVIYTEFRTKPPSTYWTKAIRPHTYNRRTLYTTLSIIEQWHQRSQHHLKAAAVHNLIPDMVRTRYKPIVLREHRRGIPQSGDQINSDLKGLTLVIGGITKWDTRIPCQALWITKEYLFFLLSEYECPATQFVTPHDLRDIRSLFSVTV